MGERMSSVDHRLASAVDVHVGGRVKLRRAYLGMSQSAMAAQLGITWQQCAKYERGLNRIGAARLFDLSQVLDVPIAFFFDDMPDDLRQSLSGRPRSVSNQGYSRHTLSNADEQLIKRKDTWEVLHAFYAISSAKTRNRVLELLKTMADAGEAPDDSPRSMAPS
jgi:transcriptional regulator with XRE-family HTH domain